MVRFLLRDGRAGGGVDEPASRARSGASRLAGCGLMGIAGGRCLAELHKGSPFHAYYTDRG